MSLPYLRAITLSFGLGIAGCSLFLDLESAQCQIDDDCRKRGGAFSEMICAQGSCVRPGSAQEGQIENAGGSSVSESKNLAGASPDAAGASGTASTGCTSTTACVSDHLDEPYLCAEGSGECLALKSTECPLIFGEYDNDNAVYVGAFLNLPAASPLSQMSTLNVKLAVDEFNGSVGGLPGGPLGKLRPLVFVVCRNDPALLEAGAKHLIERVGVRAVLAHLPSAELKTFFVEHALPNKVFVINPGFADNSLTSLSSEGLFWHVIGDIRDVAPVYAPLLLRIEAYLNLTPDIDLRVAMLVTKRYAEQSIADSITPTLRFNGKTISENGSNFFSTAVTALADDPDADYSRANADLLAFKPHVVIALTREEFVYKMLPAIEASWQSVANGQPRPFYVVPTALSGNQDLLNYIAQDSDGTTSDSKRRRFAGVAPASATDLTLYNQYLVRFRTAFPHFQNPGGFENFYDAAYLLANALFAAGSVPKLTGPDIARGIQRVVAGSSVIDVGPTHIADGFAALAVGGAIKLNGTMGISDFDPGLGARRGNGSVYCFAENGPTLAFAYDVLRYDKSTKQLNGTFPCFSF